MQVVTVISRSFGLLYLFSLYAFIPQSIAVAGEIPLGPKIVIANTPRDEETPQVTYNSVDKNFLISWIDRLYEHEEAESRIMARFLRPDRSLSASRVYMKGHSLLGLLVQNDPQHNRYFMICDSVPMNYRLLGPAGGVNKSGKIAGAYSVALTYHPLNEEYFAATPLQRFSKNGEPKGKVSNDEQLVAVLIADPASGNYFYFYRDSELTIYYQILHSDGTAATAPRTMLRNTYDFSAAFNPSRREFLLVYASPFSTWRAFRLNENGQRLGNTVTLANRTETYSSTIYYNDRFFVAYNRENRIFLRELDAEARPLGSPLALTDEGAFVSEFALARGDGRSFTISWIEEDGDGVEPFTFTDVFARRFRLP